MMLKELEVMEGQETETWVADPTLDWLGSMTSPIAGQAVDFVETSRQAVPWEDTSPDHHGLRPSICTSIFGFLTTTSP